jgi:hypothetical protein
MAALLMVAGHTEASPAVSPPTQRPRSEAPAAVSDPPLQGLLRQDLRPVHGWRMAIPAATQTTFAAILRRVPAPQTPGQPTEPAGMAQMTVTTGIRTAHPTAQDMAWRDSALSRG